LGSEKIPDFVLDRVLKDLADRIKNARKMHSHYKREIRKRIQAQLPYSELKTLKKLVAIRIRNAQKYQ